MHVTFIVPGIVCLVGAFIYMLATSPKVAELGRLAFFAGLLAICVVYAGATVRVG